MTRLLKSTWSLRFLTVLVFPITITLAYGFNNSSYLGLLLLTMPLASLGWRNVTSVLSVTALSGLVALGGFLTAENPLQVDLMIFLIALLGLIFYKKTASEMLAGHTERQVLEELEDEIVLL